MAKLLRSFRGGKKKPPPDYSNHGSSTASPPVTLWDVYDFKEKMKGVKNSMKDISKKAEKIKHKKKYTDYDFRDEFATMENAVEALKQCFRCDDGETNGETYGFPGNKRQKTRVQSGSAEVTVHGQSEPVADYNFPQQQRQEERFDNRKPFKRSRSVNENIKKSQRELENELQVREETCSRLSNELRHCKAELKRYTSELQKEIKIREEAQSRLSELMGKQLKTNNPAITDLSDPCRPLNLAEKFSNLYDNEWTDAIEEVEKLTNESLASKILLTVVTDSYDECHALRHRGKPVIGVENGSCRVTRQIKEIPEELGLQLKKLDKSELDKLFQVVLQKQEGQVDRNVLSCLSRKRQYIAKCVELSWMMVCHSPPVHLEWNYKGQSFDHQILKPFTEDGTAVQFMVWPVMFLHKDGPMLCKGVAQGTGSVKRQTHF